MDKIQTLLLCGLYILYGVNNLLLISNKSFVVTFFDVGQGDSAIIKTSSNKLFLIDGGPNADLDLKLSKYTNPVDCFIDVVILTHPHADHYKGLNRALSRCKVGQVLASSNQGLEALNLTKSTKTHIVRAGEVMCTDSACLDFVWPSRAFMATYSGNNLNLESVVFVLRYRDFEVLFTGDAEDKALSMLNPLDLKIKGDLDVLKAAHHGSRNGLVTPLFGPLNVRAVVISSGSGNSYKHPHPEVINFFTNTARAKIFRTDLVGDINFVLSK